MTGGLLQVEGVTKSYGDHVALRGVDLDVGPGEICGLLGPNGAGKTSLVSIIAGLRRADDGRVTVDGLDVATDASTRRLVGLAAQETAIYPTLKVRANLELLAGINGLGKKKTAERIEEVADVLELGEFLDRKARFMSGGEKRRLHTAMAMLHRPRLLLLDEPTTGVDIATRSRLLASIRELAAREGCAVVYSTHYLPEIEELDASVAIIDRGRLLARGVLTDLIAEHGSGRVELTFDGPVPVDAVAAAAGDAPVRVDGATAIVESDQPGPAAAHLLAALGEGAANLASVELRHPSLETVFLTITGRTYRSDDTDQSDGSTAEAGPTPHAEAEVPS